MKLLIALLLLSFSASAQKYKPTRKDVINTSADLVVSKLYFDYVVEGMDDENFPDKFKTLDSISAIGVIAYDRLDSLSVLISNSPKFHRRKWRKLYNVIYYVQQSYDKNIFILTRNKYYEYKRKQNIEL